MRIVILGAGALGVYFGVRWIELGSDVTFLVREKRAAQIRENGLKINSTQGDYEIKNPQVATEPSEIESADLVLVSVKGYHLDGTLAHLKALTNKGAYVLPVLNGIEHISVLQEELGKEKVIGGLSFIFASLNDKGHVEQSGDMHHLIFGPLESSQQGICRRLEEFSRDAGFISKYSDNISLELWKKYMFITALSGVTTAANLPIGAIREHAETFHIAKMILREMQSLAAAYGAEIPDQEVESAIQNVHALDPEATSSMHKDRRKGLRLEVDHLQGGAVRLAENTGLEVPYIRAVLGLIKPFERE
ncbi:2-dehydropantoate 2-reductase [Lentibacillus halodurans]|uniref:2-dehydropantoate 2-reductase n=1 Tax=Lentibacillus halodurans TaxID=237679 RepID=A0A1I0ZS50_9BACI|nr:ketopantoate reductase family protein [Lentibacillus halodurans]SFB28495.1 2-dehydropantoate 2-reductase [Lentibacillus halodurans]